MEQNEELPKFHKHGVALPLRMFSDSSLGLIFPCDHDSGIWRATVKGKKYEVIVPKVDPSLGIEAMVQNLYELGHIVIMSVYNSALFAMGRTPRSLPLAVLEVEDWDVFLEPYEGKLSVYMKQVYQAIRAGPGKADERPGGYRIPKKEEMILFCGGEDTYALKVCQVMPPPPHLSFLDILEQTEHMSSEDKIAYVLTVAAEVRVIVSAHVKAGNDIADFLYSRHVKWVSYAEASGYFPPPQKIVQVSREENPYQKIGYHVSRGYESYATPETDSPVIIQEIKKLQPQVIMEPFCGFGSDTAHLVQLPVLEVEVSDIDPIRVGFCYHNGMVMNHRAGFVTYSARTWSDALLASQQEMRQVVMYLDPPWDSIKYDDSGGAKWIVGGVDVQKVIEDTINVSYVLKIPVPFRFAGWRRRPSRQLVCPSGKVKIAVFPAYDSIARKGCG